MMAVGQVIASGGDFTCIFFVEMEERRQSKIMGLCGIWRQHFKLVSFFQVGTSDIYIGIKCKLQCGEKILYASIWSVGKEVLSI